MIIYAILILHFDCVIYYSEKIQHLMEEMMHLMKVAFDDMSEYLLRNGWLGEIFLFTENWTIQESVQQLKSSPAYVIEVRGMLCYVAIVATAQFI